MDSPYQIGSLDFLHDWRPITDIILLDLESNSSLLDHDDPCWLF